MSTLLVGGFSLTIGAAPASATVTTLCKGYTACANAGMSDSGYSSWRSTMYWRMYAGHNCTNYAAYRMVQAGLPNTRPWTGSGNATNWGTVMSRITDGTPAVGAVAWWKAGVRPAGSVGHVAYVEKVVSADEIIVSQDSWGGDFSWARITRTSSGWPSGFIHFSEARLQNTAIPTVTGTARVGSTLAASPGLWNPSSATVAYQWLQNGAAISGATDSTLALQQPQQGRTITVRVTASSSGVASASVVSSATAAVASAVPTPVAQQTLQLASPPTVSGTARPDSTLALALPSIAPSADVAVQWYRAGVVIPGATRTTYKVTTADLGSRMLAQVRLTRPGFTPLTRRTSSTRIVRATPVIRVSATPGAGTLAVTASVRAAGVSSVAGTIQIRSRGKLIRAVPVTSGVARTTVTSLPSGTRTYRFWFLTSPTVSSGAVAKRVAIR